MKPGASFEQQRNSREQAAVMNVIFFGLWVKP